MLLGMEVREGLTGVLEGGEKAFVGFFKGGDDTTEPLFYYERNLTNKCPIVDAL